jgi:predicted GIY-YIG superfamily endonuclease
MTGYIYKITNLINQKAYIGKTINSIEERWKEHKKEAIRQRAENRPLYKALNKYGIENFSVELVEEVDVKNLSEREIYWIGYYHTYTEGYNATLGGDGKILYDYDLIAELILQDKTYLEISKIVGCCTDVVSFVAKKYNIDHQPRNNFVENSKQVFQFDKQGNYIQSFPSYAAAAQWLEDNGYVKGNLNGVRSHIGDVCKGKRKTAYKFVWKNNID